jgi:membrane associated rhomboid family serine protease
MIKDPVRRNSAANRFLEEKPANGIILMNDQEPVFRYRQNLQQQIIILGGFIALIWAVEAVDWLMGGALDQFGIAPRQASGLFGIAAAPFLHGGFAHLAANTIPFLVLGWLVLLRGQRTLFSVAAIVVVIGGLGTWLIAPSRSIHIGSSGLIFGFLGYLVMRGYFERSWQAIGLAVGVLILYGGMLAGLFPSGMMVSWQMHLFGFIGGGVAAYLLSNGRVQTADRL